MSNKARIDYTKWTGVTFFGKSAKMDVFLVNGAPINMSTRPLGPQGKQVAFQKKPLQPQVKDCFSFSSYLFITFENLSGQADEETSQISTNGQEKNPGSSNKIKFEN